MYLSADPFCRACVGGARRARAARIALGAAGVLLALTLGTGVMLAAIPAHVQAHWSPPPRPAACGANDMWLEQASTDLERLQFHAALHHLSLSQRDCAGTARRDELYTRAYEGVGDHMAALAAASRWVDSSHGTDGACASFIGLARPEGEMSRISDPRCPHF